MIIFLVISPPRTEEIPSVSSSFYSGPFDIIFPYLLVHTCRHYEVFKAVFDCRQLH